MDDAARPAPRADTPDDPMAGRIARFADVRQRGIPLMFIDSVLPGHQRMNYALVGDTASENPEYSPVIAAPHGFQIGMVKAQPGNGPAYHTHRYVESFLVLSGRWRFYWGRGDDPAACEGETTLEPWDFISLPPDLYRGYEVAPGETETAWLFAVLEEHAVFAAKDPIWSPEVVRQAARAGFHADETGKMILPDDYAEVRARLLAQLDATREVDAGR